jgi:hypothetical protein
MIIWRKNKSKKNLIVYLFIFINIFMNLTKFLIFRFILSVFLSIKLI